MDDKLKDLGRKYASATQWFDNLIEKKFIDMSYETKTLVNQIGNEILDIIKENENGKNKI